MTAAASTLASYGASAPLPLPAAPPAASATLELRGVGAVPVLPLPSSFPPVAGLSETARNTVLERALVGGALAPHLLRWVPVTVEADGLRGVVEVAPDWIGFGGPDALFRVPLPAQALQRVAARYGATLATPRLVDAIHAQGAVRVPFRGLRPLAERAGLRMNNIRVWQMANAHIEGVRQGRAGLVTDGAKDVVIGAMQRRAFPRKVCIYGGWNAEGRVQSESTIHAITYVDYSQLGRLVRDTMQVIGVGPMRVVDVLAHPRYFRLLDDRGPIRNAGYT